MSLALTLFVFPVLKSGQQPIDGANAVPADLLLDKWLAIGRWTGSWWVCIASPSQAEPTPTRVRVANITEPFGCEPNAPCKDCCIPALLRFLCHKNVAHIVEVLWNSWKTIRWCWQVSRPKYTYIEGG
jgi:hypothetical protein